MSATPLEAVFLGIDPAKHTSGAGILIPDYGGMDEADAHPFQGGYALAEFGKVESQSERERFVESLIETALELELPPIVVAEEWDPPRIRKTKLPGGGFGLILDQRWTPSTILGMGEGWGRWAAELESADEYLREEHKHPGLLIWRVTPNVWRDAILPAPRPKETEPLKAMAQNFFEGVFGYKASSDISEAACIALYGAHCPDIATAAMEKYAKKKKKRVRKAS